MTRPVQVYLTRLEVLAHREAATDRRLELMAAAARELEDTRLTEAQPTRCGSCGAWTPPGVPCRTGCALAG